MSTVSYRDFTGTGAENYQRYFVPAIGAPVSTVTMAAAGPQLGERVLDVACGTGVVTRLAAERVGPTGSVTGVDVAPDMIDVARATPAPGAPTIDWHVGDALSLPFPDDAFDVVTCQMGLMFMEDRAKALTETRRVLRPGGRLVVTTPGTIQPLFEVMERAIVDHIGAELGGFVRAVFSMHDPDAVGALVRDAGFNDFNARESIATLQLPGPADFLWQYINLTPMATFVAAAPESAQAAMEHQFVDGAQSFVVDGGMHVAQPMVIASGTA
jgi:SAM-dependent methyltransferase